MDIRHTRCPVCGSAVERAFLRRKGVPVHQNLLMDNAASARAVARGDLELAACDACGFVFNSAFDQAKMAYGERYENTQDCSPAFAAHMDKLALEIARDLPAGAAIVEIGCGKGSFLRALLRAAPGARGTGFDPSYVGPETDCDGRARFERRFFDEHAHVERVDAVVCRHVIEHIPEPVKLLDGLRRMPITRMYFETPCVNWILRNRVIWDVFYEHCSYFSPGSLTTAFERAGFTTTRVRHVFAGQYLWAEAGAARAPASAPASGRAGETPALARAFGGAYDGLVDDWQQRIAALGARGKIAAWGAGAKGVTLANVVDPARTLLECIIDLNPGKQGRFVPGTGHPIVSPQDAVARGVRTALLMNPNYRQENEALVRAAALPIELQA